MCQVVIFFTSRVFLCVLCYYIFEIKSDGSHWFVGLIDLSLTYELIGHGPIEQWVGVNSNLFSHGFMCVAPVSWIQVFAYGIFCRKNRGLFDCLEHFFQTFLATFFPSVRARSLSLSFKVFGTSLNWYVSFIYFSHVNQAIPRSLYVKCNVWID